MTLNMMIHFGVANGSCLWHDLLEQVCAAPIPRILDPPGPVCHDTHTDTYYTVTNACTCIHAHLHSHPRSHTHRWRMRLSRQVDSMSQSRCASLFLRVESWVLMNPDHSGYPEEAAKKKERRQILNFITVTYRGP